MDNEIKKLKSQLKYIAKHLLAIEIILFVLVILVGFSFAVVLAFR